MQGIKFEWNLERERLVLAEEVDTVRPVFWEARQTWNGKLVCRRTDNSLIICSAHTA